jgi:putative NIF3 family GTP cyclohydrolase 1 type 2
MLTSTQLIERIQKNIGVPWQSQQPDGYSDGILFGNSEVAVTGIATTFTPTLDVLRKAVASGKNTIICREGPFYSRGERSPLYFRGGPAPSKELLNDDLVGRSKREFLTHNNLSIIRFHDNWDARAIDGQLLGLVRALAWEAYHSKAVTGAEKYDSRNLYFQAPAETLSSLAHRLKSALKIQGVRVIGDRSSSIRTVALVHGLLLVAQAETILREHNVDVVVAGDAVEWEIVPYFQDLVKANMSKGLILLGEEASEEPGSEEVARWLKTFVNEVPIEWIPAGEPFWTLAKGVSR